MTEYTSSFLCSTCVECLVQGNISAQRSTELSSSLKSIFLKFEKGSERGVSLGDAHNPPQQVNLLPLDKAIVMCVAPRNPNDNNKCVEAYFQLGEYGTCSRAKERCATSCLCENPDSYPYNFLHCPHFAIQQGPTTCTI